MQRERKPADSWADLKSADLIESQTKQGRALCHIEHVHGHVINVTLPTNARLSSLLDALGCKKESTCGA